MKKPTVPSVRGKLRSKDQGQNSFNILVTKARVLDTHQTPNCTFEERGEMVVHSKKEASCL